MAKAGWKMREDGGGRVSCSLLGKWESRFLLIVFCSLFATYSISVSCVKRQGIFLSDVSYFFFFFFFFFFSSAVTGARGEHCRGFVYQSQGLC